MLYCENLKYVELISEILNSCIECWIEELPAVDVPETQKNEEY